MTVSRRGFHRLPPLPSCRRWRGRSPPASAVFRCIRPSRAGAARLSSSRVPPAMILPSCRMAIRSASCSASSRYCVVSRIVVPPPASFLMVFQTSSRPSGSSPVVGSSRKMTAGVPTRLMAMSSLRAMPPEYVSDPLLGRVGQPELCQQAVGNLGGVGHGPQFGNEHEVLPAGENAVHGGELAGQADLLAHLFGLARRVEAADAGAAAVRLEKRGEDVDRRRLAGAVRSEQCEDLAAPHFKVDAFQDFVSP